MNQHPAAPPRVKVSAQMSSALFVGLYLVLVVRRAWVSDDAYITFRTIENFLSGYGLRWNVIERVQSYTHPLWMFVITGARFITGEFYYTVLAVSLVCSLAAIISLRGLARTSQQFAIGVLVLALSNAFVDYSTSGLENPLTFLLLVVFCAQWFRYDGDPWSLGKLSLLASLGALNRLDTALLFYPALAFALVDASDRRRGLAWLVIGQIPLVLWELFSLIYYGFPFPNTYYAKLNTGIPAEDLAHQGLLYLLDGLRSDPITPLVIALGLVSLVTRRDWRRSAQGHLPRNLPLGIGLTLYLVYVVRIGGDFMAGRFLAVPLLCAVIILVRLDLEGLPASAFWTFSTLMVGVGLAAPLPTYQVGVNAGHDARWNGIINERVYYSSAGTGGTGLFNQTRGDVTPPHQSRDLGDAVRHAAQDDMQVSVLGALGLAGYYGGPDAFWIDLNALNDPLLARLPSAYNPFWRVGHFKRGIPEGYRETLATGHNLLADPDLAEYYDHLTLITRGDLWDFDRFKTILKMNLGQYDHLIDTFHYRFPDVVTVAAGELTTEVIDRAETLCEDYAGNEVGSHGLLAEFQGPVSAEHIALGLDGDIRWQVQYRLEGDVVAEQTLDKVSAAHEIAHWHLDVPGEAVRRGYDSLHFLPQTDRDTCCVAYLNLTFHTDVAEKLFALMESYQPGDPVILEGKNDWQYAIATYLAEASGTDPFVFHLVTPESRDAVKDWAADDRVAAGASDSTREALDRFVGNAARVWYLSEQRTLLNSPLIAHLENRYAPAQTEEVLDGGRFFLTQYRPALAKEIVFDEDIWLRFWEVSTLEATACESLTLSSTWWTKRLVPDAGYSLSLALIDNGSSIANTDNPPGGSYPADWTPGEYVIDTRSLQIPCDLPPGEYSLILVMYEVETLEPILADGERHVFLTTVRILPQP